eukprot:TRINITY_DN8668_c0_g1_i4.p1 TRINITY_DN8668_c0_g1~~TRINITY_DN8668_c0_g1_i4.p1  ORF type:complete len:223 (+),score=-16.56 TRINITY_DN8668_c0_g1_i4:870-1538(+)
MQLIKCMCCLYDIICCLLWTCNKIIYYQKVDCEQLCVALLLTIFKFKFKVTFAVLANYKWIILKELFSCYLFFLRVQQMVICFLCAINILQNLNQSNNTFQIQNELSLSIQDKILSVISLCEYTNTYLYINIINIYTTTCMCVDVCERVCLYIYTFSHRYRDIFEESIQGFEVEVCQERVDGISLSEYTNTYFTYKYNKSLYDNIHVCFYVYIYIWRYREYT